MSFVLSLIEAFPLGAAHRDVQSPTGLKFVKELFLQRIDNVLIRRHMDQVVSFMGISFQIVETIMIPHAVRVDILVLLSARGKDSGRGRKIPLPVIFVQDMVAPGNGLTLL